MTYYINRLRHKYIRWFSDLYYAIRHRTIDRYNVIYIPSLRPAYYDKDIQIFYGLMDLLVDFVEVEKASLELILMKCRYNIPWYMTYNQFLKKNGRMLGLAYLDWDIAVGKENQGQSEAAREIKEIYLWYKDEYPKLSKNGQVWYHTDEGRDLHESENEMLHRLINIRDSLWT